MQTEETKLLENQIIQLRGEGKTNVEIARQLGYTTSHIVHIVIRLVREGRLAKRRKGPPNTDPQPETLTYKVWRMSQAGMPPSDIAEYMEMEKEAINNIISGLRRRKLLPPSKKRPPPSMACWIECRKSRVLIVA